MSEGLVFDAQERSSTRRAPAETAKSRQLLEEYQNAAAGVVAANKRENLKFVTRTEMCRTLGVTDTTLLRRFEVIGPDVAQKGEIPLISDHAYKYFEAALQIKNRGEVVSAQSLADELSMRHDKVILWLRGNAASDRNRHYIDMLGITVDNPGKPSRASRPVRAKKTPEKEAEHQELEGPVWQRYKTEAEKIAARFVGVSEDNREALRLRGVGVNARTIAENLGEKSWRVESFFVQNPDKAAEVGYEFGPDAKVRMRR